MASAIPYLVVLLMLDPIDQCTTLRLAWLYGTMTKACHSLAENPAFTPNRKQAKKPKFFSTWLMSTFLLLTDHCSHICSLHSRHSNHPALALHMLFPVLRASPHFLLLGLRSNLTSSEEPALILPVEAPWQPSLSLSPCQNCKCAVVTQAPSISISCVSKAWSSIRSMCNKWLNKCLCEWIMCPVNNEQAYLQWSYNPGSLLCGTWNCSLPFIFFNQHYWLIFYIVYNVKCILC